MKLELLQLEVDMLLLKYGEASVLKALATATTCTEDGLQERLAVLKSKKVESSSRRFARKQPLEIAKEVIKGSTNEDQLLDLANLYQNKQFLPQLKDVRRFLGRFKITNNIKTRHDATRAVFESLNRCTREELEEFAPESDSDGRSSFEKLAEQIMGEPERESHDD